MDRERQVVVDDEPSSCDSLRHIFERHAHEVLMAGDAEQSPVRTARRQVTSTARSEDDEAAERDRPRYSTRMEIAALRLPPARTSMRCSPRSSGQCAS